MYAEILVRVEVNNKVLSIIYDKGKEGLHYMKSDDEVKQNILLYTNEIFNYAVTRLDDKSYILNIASTEDYGDFDWEGDPWSNSLLRKQINIYKPLIQKFIIDAMNNSL